MSLGCCIVAGGVDFVVLLNSKEDITYNHIIGLENLLSAWEEFLRGKRKRHDVQIFQAQLMDQVLSLHTDLKNKTYRHGQYEAFNISDPKPRNIHKACVRDRLLHHAIHRQLYPYFDAKFIDHSYSCRENKGTHKALRTFAAMARQASFNHTKTCYILKCDVRKFFASIDHEILSKVLAKHSIEKKVLCLLQLIVKSFETAPGKGLPLGNLTSQLLVNVYMNEFDQFIKHKLKVQSYIRYADDFVVFSDNRDYLEMLLEKMGQFLEEKLALQLHPRKVSITTVASGVDFLGWVHFPYHKVLRTVTKRRMLKRLIVAAADSPTRQSYLGLLSHGNAYKLKLSILAAPE